MLYHFSDDPGITRFVPRALKKQRPSEQEWLNGPLVWAISEAFAFLYLFPRDCPRIVTWAGSGRMARAASTCVLCGKGLDAADRQRQALPVCSAS